jgi:hypothetical protein
MEALIDLLYLFIPYVQGDNVNMIYESLKMFVISPELTMQKKSMKVIEFDSLFFLLNF